MLFKVGDKAVVISELKRGEDYLNEIVTYDMLSFAGKTVTIMRVFDNGYYRIKEDSRWLWTDEMFCRPDIVSPFQKWERTVNHVE